MKLSEIAQTSGLAFGTSGARGLVSAMSSQVCHCFTRAFLNVLAADSDEVVLGHDLRPSSPVIAQACVQAIQDTGKRVVYVGALPTPAIAYFAILKKAPAIVVTGSHIPFDRNGIKFYRADGEISKADEVAMLEAEVDVPIGQCAVQLPEVEESAAATYVARYVDFFGLNALLGKRIALYEHSSVGRDLLREILTALGAEVISLGRTDTFVPIDTEAVRPEDVEKAKAWAEEYKFDAIVSTDGDADRPLIGDENGVWLRGDTVGTLCAKELGADIVVTPVSSNTAVEKCNAFEKVVRTRIGSPYVIEGMLNVALERPQVMVVGYEANGGFLLGSDFEDEHGLLRALPTRDAVLPIVVLLITSQRKKISMSRQIDTLPLRFTASDRIKGINSEISIRLMEILQSNTLKAAALCAPDAGKIVNVDATDGLRLIFEFGDIVHLRASGNAPELRCYAEAGTSMRSETLCSKALKRVWNDFVSNEAIK